MMTCIWPITNWAWVGWRHANHTKCGYMSDEINDKNDDGTNVADAVSPSGEIEVLDIKRADSSSGRNGGKGGRNGGRREYKPFPGWLYGVLFVVFDMAAVAALQWGVSQSGTRVQLSSPVVGWGFVSKMWAKGNFVFVLNLLLIGALYLALLMLFNRFWIATPVLLAVAIIVGVIEHFKVSIRYEAILPSDLGFLGSNTGNLMSFTPPGAHWIILGALAVFLVFVALFVVLNHVDGRHGRMIRFDNKGLAAGIRLMVFLLPSLFFGLYCDQVSTVGSWANGFSKALGDTPSMWDSVYDAQRNGPLVSFTRQLNPTIMDEPSDYSEATMKEVVKRYEAAAEHDRFDGGLRAVRIVLRPRARTRCEAQQGRHSGGPCHQIRHDQRSDAVVRIRWRHREPGVYGIVGPEHGEFRLVSDQPVPAAGTGAALDADDQPDVGGSEELHRLPPV